MLIAAFIISLAALVLSVVILCIVGSGIAIIDQKIDSLISILNKGVSEQNQRLAPQFINDDIKDDEELEPEYWASVEE